MVSSGMTDEDWRVQFKLRAEILLPGVQRVVLTSGGGEKGDSQEVEQVDFGRSGDADSHDVTIMLRTTDQAEAWKRGNWWSEEVASLISFLASRRTRVEKLYITNKPAIALLSKNYRAMIAPDAAATIATPPEVNPNDLNILLKTRPERASRALRWLRKARDNAGTIDEFICLIVSLESVCHLLGPPGYMYWQCANCQHQVRTCPSCGKSTKRKKSGADVLKDFTVGTLGWTEKDWKAVWNLRNALVHGEQDLMGDEAYSLLPKLESAVVAALKTIFDLPSSHAPATLGLRGTMVGTGDARFEVRRDSMYLDVTYRA